MNVNTFTKAMAGKQSEELPPPQESKNLDAIAWNEWLRNPRTKEFLRELSDRIESLTAFATGSATRHGCEMDVAKTMTAVGELRKLKTELIAKGN